MIDKILISKIREKIKKAPHELQAYEDFFAVARNIKNEELQLSLTMSQELRSNCLFAIKGSSEIEDFVDLSNRTLLFEAPYLFDSYMQYLEINRKPHEKFYLPRRSRLKQVVDLLQDLADDKLDELFISMPPRVGKTTLLLFFVTWILGKNSEVSNLYSAYSDIITSALYSGVLEVINDAYTYTWDKVFPESKIVNTNAKDEIINIDRKKRYPSLTCRSLYGTLNGACDCNGYLISDDLIGGIEEALNKDRLVAAWSKVDNNLIPRAKEKAKVLWCGTRWSMIDPMGIRADLLENDENYKNRKVAYVSIPALDPQTDESNFVYKYQVGFSTDFYKQRRASFERNNDMASWTAQYMGEPIERSGALFIPEDMRYYNGILPDETPDRIFLAVDPAFGGGDFVSAPVCYQFGNNIYVHDVVFDPGDKRITQPRVVDLILKHKIQAARFESNNGGEGYKSDIETALKKKKYRLNITMRYASNRGYKAGVKGIKELRIFDKAPEIREFYFLENGKRSKDYNLFMQNLFSFRVVGKNKNDDAPDSLVTAVEMKNDTGCQVEVIARPF